MEYLQNLLLSKQYVDRQREEGKAARTTQLFGIYDIYFEVGSLIRKDVFNDNL